METKMETQKKSRIKTIYKAYDRIARSYWSMPLQEKAMMATAIISGLDMAYSAKIMSNLLIHGSPTVQADIREAGISFAYGIAFLGVTAAIKGASDIIRKTRDEGISGPTALGVGTFFMGLGYIGLAALGHKVGSPEFNTMAWTAGVMGVCGPIGAWIQNYEAKKAVKVKID